MLGLPDSVTTCLFDLDGVLTDTASVHRKAWKQAFDPLLADHREPEFTDNDYNDHVDGKPRADGVRDFLRSRGIDLPEGKDDDPPEANTVSGVGNRKNALLLKAIHEDGVKVFDDARQYLEAARDAGLQRIVVSSSANTKDVLHVTGLEQFVEGRVDGVTIKEKQLHGKPAPDSFIEGARIAGVTPEQAAVFEDALSGVQAGRAGKFGYVVGVNRLDEAHASGLKKNGASVVVEKLTKLL
ncbi:MAG TPA: beta-phosphoglucomutase family hydrolase [Jatrophihabitantaceae bacterium]|jgi:beta-phosphoglucomutase family hydrolase|nr:beta-phosphoglucomutase family hydrolase [Jatrophihabitantaceae bacterium]